MQTALPILLAFTFPSERNAIGSSPSGFSGVFHHSNRLHVLTPLALIFVTSLANMVAVGPATTKCMRDRKSQEYKDGKKSYDAPPHSADMENLNKQFSVLHGVSSSLNMVGCIATVWYGFYLGERML